MATARRGAFRRTDTPVTPPTTGGGSLYNDIVIQKTSSTRLAEADIPAPYTRGYAWIYQSTTYYFFVNSNDNNSVVLTTDITNVDATARVGAINRI